MADDWEDEPAFDTPTTTSSFAEGTSFNRGRGYAPPPKQNDDWGKNHSDQSSGFGTTEDSNDGRFDDNEDDNGDRRGRDGGGRGRGGRGGGRGGRGCFRGGDRDDAGFGGDRRRRDDDGGFGGNRRRRDDDGGGRRRRDDDGAYGGGDGDADREKDEDGEEKKPAAVTYVPPERTEDEMYAGGVTPGINFDDYDSIEVNITGENPVRPIEKFSDIKLRTILAENIVKSHYDKPTPVQKHAIPIILNGRDLMACAQTGSGKTAAYLLPILQTLLENPRDRTLTERGCEPQVVVMAPTRELADQICTEARKFARETILKCAAVYGGVKTMYQGDQLRAGVDIVVATPGRLNDFVNHGRVKFSSIRFVVLDEADRMLDQGFLPDMEKILNHESMVPSGERQTLMFSATFSPEIQRLCSNYLKNYLFLAVGIVGGACKHVEQIIYEVSKREKRSKLKELLDEDRPNLTGDTDNQVKVLVFVETKKTADFIAAFLCEHDFPTTSIHGDRLQMERERALSDFRSGRMPILVATSVAARGLDIKDVSHVINYDLPKSIDDYVHRIGRTGRVGNRGKASSFYDPGFDAALKDDLMTILAGAAQPIPEFFGSDGNYGDAGASNSAFGAYDIRNNMGGGNGAVNEPEEEW